VNKEILRKYLEIKSIKDLRESKYPGKEYNLNLIEKDNFQLNKFLYKQIGKKHRWIDRLEWTDQKWIEYVSNKNLLTFILKKKEDVVGYFELVVHHDKKEIEIAYFGILEEYFGQKLGGYLLSEAIKKSFSMGINRVWLHTCSLDHDNALKNYLSRGMKIFKEESLKL
jgi:ribosomal protein S18 acetylase RimI-like enzyme|tara:strand:+ start:45 stop:548 length:504 start_codon:yes stop_codon:yes gene_type:complete